MLRSRVSGVLLDKWTKIKKRRTLTLGFYCYWKSRYIGCIPSTGCNFSRFPRSPFFHGCRWPDFGSEYYESRRETTQQHCKTKRRFLTVMFILLKHFVASVNQSCHFQRPPSVESSRVPGWRMRGYIFVERISVF